MKERFARNILFSLIFQLCSMICGFVLPRQILSAIGSETNGLVNSISQFLSVISMADMGVSAVIQSALYVPIHDKDNEKINRIVSSGRQFYWKLAQMMWVYILILAIFYPLIIESNFSFAYISFLVVCMSFSQYVQSYVGVTESMFLNAHQKSYIGNALASFSMMINTILCTIAIKSGFGIHAVKLITSGTFLIRPIFLKLYVNKHYNITRIPAGEEPLEQKWNGLLQHIGGIVIEGTDNIILTFFSNLISVSVYSVYYLVVHGINVLITTIANNSLLSVLGEFWAKNKDDEFDNKFEFIEWGIHVTVTYLFTCTRILIVDFVRVYTRGINDTNYIQPFFSTLLVIANMLWCIRLPYHMVIKAANKYKETQKCYLIAALINIILSIISVKAYGLVGVTVGTMVAMCYQTIWMFSYVNNELMSKTHIKEFVKLIILDIFLFVVCSLIFKDYMPLSTNYTEWVFSAILVILIVGITFILVQLICCRDKILMLKNLLLKRGRL